MTNDIILTGIERSGTTLICHLLNKLPDVVALHEPMKTRKFSKFATREELREYIEHYFAKTRKSLKDFGQAISQHVDGKIPDNTFAGQRPETGLREFVDVKGVITIDKPLSDDFILCIKHLGPFTAILENLLDYFPCFAMVRNPLAILASWNSVDLPVRDGHHPAVEKLDADLAAALSQISDRFERQIYLLSWHFEKYLLLPESAVLRYENIIESSGKCLTAIQPAANTLNETLTNMNKNKLYDRDLMQMLGEKLVKSSGAFWKFYPKESVESLLVCKE